MASVKWGKDYRKAYIKGHGRFWVRLHMICSAYSIWYVLPDLDFEEAWVTAHGRILQFWYTRIIRKMTGCVLLIFKPVAALLTYSSLYIIIHFNQASLLKTSILDIHLGVVHHLSRRFTFEHPEILNNFLARPPTTLYTLDTSKKQTNPDPFHLHKYQGTFFPLTDHFHWSKLFKILPYL